MAGANQGDEYPKAIYRDGGAELVWGEPIQTSAANSADEENEALADGWRLHPDKSTDPETRAPASRKVRTKHHGADV